MRKKPGAPGLASETWDMSSPDSHLNAFARSPGAPGLASETWDGRPLLPPKRIRPFEFLAQRGSAQVLANVGKALLQRVQRSFNGRGVGVGDVAPHGKWAGAETRHFAESPAAHVLQFGCVADLVFQHRTQSRRRELRQMADPCNQLIVARRVEIDRFRS